MDTRAANAYKDAQIPGRPSWICPDTPNEQLEKRPSYFDSYTFPFAISAVFIRW